MILNSQRGNSTYCTRERSQFLTLRSKSKNSSRSYTKCRSLMWISGSPWIRVHNSSSHKKSKLNRIIEVKILGREINFRIRNIDKIRFQKLSLIRSHNMSLIEATIQVESMGINSNLILRNTRTQSRSWLKSQGWRKHHLLATNKTTPGIKINIIDYLSIPKILREEIFLLQLRRKKGISQWHNLSWWL